MSITIRFRRPTPFGFAAAALIALMPACRTLPDSMMSLASSSKQPGAAQTQPAAQPAPLPAEPVRVIGAAPKKPAVGEALPQLPRDACDYSGGVPIPYGAGGRWQPPGIKGPWPKEEYLHDGGDDYEPVGVAPDWRVEGLNVEDTVAHYDTLDGRTLVAPSNCTYIYAPRFSSVRSVVNVVSKEYVDGPTRMSKPQAVVLFDERARVGVKTEQAQPIGQTANVKLNVFKREQRDGVFSTALLPHNFQQSLAAFEDLSVIRTGIMVGAEKARLAERVESAIVWSKDDGVKVAVDKQAATILTGDKRAQAIYIVDEPTNARLRICKIASTPAAQPGDIVEFTIRYDNVGDAKVGNVVILDSLTARLEYVADSAQSSRKAYFSTASNPAESLELRWEIDDVIEPGEGGLVRFKCKVR